LIESEHNDEILAENERIAWAAQIHQTVSELIPTMLGELRPLASI
jgi:hypothetical protein